MSPNHSNRTTGYRLVRTNGKAAFHKRTFQLAAATTLFAYAFQEKIHEKFAIKTRATSSLYRTAVQQQPFCVFCQHFFFFELTICFGQMSNNHDAKSNARGTSGILILGNAQFCDGAKINFACKCKRVKIELRTKRRRR